MAKELEKAPVKFWRPEEKMLDNLELKNQILAIAEVLIPFLESDAKVGDVDKMLKRAAPLAAMRLIESLVVGQTGRATRESARDLLYMAGYKPVERNLNIEGSIDKMSEAQIDSILKNTLEKMPPGERKKIIRMLNEPNPQVDLLLDSKDIKETEI